jgi:putative ABC transport system permease protein
MASDFKYALRFLVKAPAFSAVAIVTLALGIGANTAIFSVVEGTLLRPLPFPRADRLVRVYEAADDSGARGHSLNLSEQTVRQWRQYGGDIFEGIAAATGVNVTVGALAGNSPRNISAARVTPNFFSILGMTPLTGRNFSGEEGKNRAAAVVIISYDFWQQYLGQQSNPVGDTVSIDEVPHTIIGVMPKTFRHPYRADLWLPLAIADASTGQPGTHYLYGVARLRPGLTIRQASTRVRQMCADINRALPDKTNAVAAYMPPLRESFIMDLRPKILVIVGAAVCALIIAAANFAGLLLTRVIEREGEFAVRVALGAGWGRLVRQQLVQALVLAAIGTFAGLVIASWVTPALLFISPEGADSTGSAMREFDYAVHFDWRVFAFATGVMLVVALGFGFLPALRASKINLRNAITSTGRGATLDRGTRRLLGSLVIAELAIAAALLIASVAAAQYFRKLANEPWGFATDRRVAFNVAFADRLFATAGDKQRSIDGVLAQLKALPGIVNATVTGPSPMNAPRDLMSCTPEGVQPPDPPGYFLSYLRTTVPDYFKTMRQPLLQGRDFAETDRPTAPAVCIVSQSFASRFWPGQNPIGKRVKWGRIDGPRPWLIVVGVVADMKAIADPRDGEVIGMVVRPLQQLLAVESYQVDEITFVVQADRPDSNIEATIRSALARADSRLAAYQMSSLDDAAANSRTTERFIFVLLSLFGGLGLVLAAVGLYGLLSLHVARRRREFGIRSALGATASQLIAVVTRQGATLLGTGFVVGASVAYIVVRVIQSEWAGMPAPTALACFSAGVVLCAAASVACWLPARRAGRVDPVMALRAE